MDLKKTNNLTRVLTWNNKSIATCSRKELIECIIHLTTQLAAVANAQKEAKK